VERDLGAGEPQALGEEPLPRLEQGGLVLLDLTQEPGEAQEPSAVAEPLVEGAQAAGDLRHLAAAPDLEEEGRLAVEGGGEERRVRLGVVPVRSLQEAGPLAQQL